MLSGWVAKSLDPPATINNIYHIVGTWVQPASKPDGGTAASYVRENKKKMKVEKKKAKLAAAMAAAAETMTPGKTSDAEAQKIPKDLSHTKCFWCKEKGHYSTSMDCPLHPSKKSQEMAAYANSTREEFEAGIFAMMKQEEE
jgi:hypothetical protein